MAGGNKRTDYVAVGNKHHHRLAVTSAPALFGLLSSLIGRCRYASAVVGHWSGWSAMLSFTLNRCSKFLEAVPTVLYGNIPCPPNAIQPMPRRLQPAGYYRSDSGSPIFHRLAKTPGASAPGGMSQRSLAGNWA